MTIEAVGHVDTISMTGGPLGTVSVRIRLEASRSLEDVVIFAKPEEIEMYRVGMPIRLQVRPDSASGDTP